MSKKKIVNKYLEKGRFYLVHDGSKSGHPALIFWKNDNRNLYLSIKTGTTYNKELIPIHYPTSKGIKRSYVNKKPFLGKRKDYFDKPLLDLKFNKIDRFILLKVSLNNPKYSKSLSRKDIRYFKNIRKKKKIRY